MSTIPLCDRCGNTLDDGHVVVYGDVADRETGYRHQEIICTLCADDDGRYDAADAAMDLERDA